MKVKFLCRYTIKDSISNLHTQLIDMASLTTTTNKSNTSSTIQSPTNVIATSINRSRTPTSATLITSSTTETTSSNYTPSTNIYNTVLGEGSVEGAYTYILLLLVALAIIWILLSVTIFYGLKLKKECFHLNRNVSRSMQTTSHLKNQLNSLLNATNIPQDLQQSIYYANNTLIDSDPAASTPPSHFQNNISSLLAQPLRIHHGQKEDVYSTRQPVSTSANLTRQTLIDNNNDRYDIYLERGRRDDIELHSMANHKPRKSTRHRKNSSFETLNSDYSNKSDPQSPQDRLGYKNYTPSKSTRYPK